MEKEKGSFWYHCPDLSAEQVEKVNAQQTNGSFFFLRPRRTRWPFQFKLRGNSFFSAPSRRPMSEETRRGSYNSAVAEYKEGLEAIRRASKTVAGAGDGRAVKASTACTPFSIWVSICRQIQMLELEQALHYNCGVSYLHLARLERRKVLLLLM